jgi:hypothetical protein
MANSQVHARGSIAIPRLIRMISPPLFGKAGVSKLKDEGQGCSSPLPASLFDSALNARAVEQQSEWA